MAVSTITRTHRVDDDGSGTTGSIMNEAELQAEYDAIDQLFSGAGSYTTLEVGGSFKADTGIVRSVVGKTANYTILGSDGLIVCTANSFTVTLPTAVGRTGRSFTVKNTGTGTITMASTSAQTIDGAAAGSAQLFPGDSLTFESDGANWVIV